MQLISLDFPYFVFRVCAFYGWEYRAVMEMPIRAFWSATACVSRISAERDMRLAKVLASVNNGEGLSSLIEGLKEEQGTPTVTIDNRRDAGATEKLRLLMGS